MGLPKVIDLFSGCGGSAVGFSQLGFDIKVAVDIDEDASRTFKLNFPGATVVNKNIQLVKAFDLLKLTGATNGDDVVIIACPPCQGFSTARRKSQCLSDQRNSLIYEFLRIVKEIKPVGFVMENVPGLSKGLGKEMFADVLSKLEKLGYSTKYEVVVAADYGVPQKRRRLVLLGVRNKEKKPFFPIITHCKDLGKSESSLTPWITVRSAISDLPPLKAGEKSLTDPIHACANLSDLNLKRLKHTPVNGGGRESWPDELILECHKKVKGYSDIYGRMRWDAPSPAITAGCSMISKGRYGHPKQNRAISLREAARLQSFPDNFVFTGNMGEIASQIGNAVPPLLAKKIGEALIETLRSLQEKSYTVRQVRSDELQAAF